MAAQRREVLLTGRDTPPAEAIQVRAGDLDAAIADGDLRRVRRGGIELVQRIYVAVRDLDWNTLPGRLEDLDVAASGDSFAIRYTRRHRGGAVDYRWRAEIEGTADGVISFRMSGEALADFPYAKIGICVHHPVDGYAGQPFRAMTPGGSVTGSLPDAIGPQIHLDDGTDLPLFEPFAELELTNASGGLVRFGFTGDLWEMEDQRNWTDASYKSASTPARLGYRHEARRGQLFGQRVIVGVRDFPGTPRPRPVLRTRPASRTRPVLRTRPAFRTRPAVTELELGGRTGARMPPVGLGCSDPATGLSERGLAVLRAIAPAHLRVDVRLGSAGSGAALAAAGSLAGRLGCGIELAVFVPGAAGGREGPVPSRESLGGSGSYLARVLAFSEAQECSSPATIDAVRAALGARPDVPVIAGTNIYFNELNRHRTVPATADGLAWSVNPQVHAFDELSLMENLRAQPDTVATARSFAQGMPLYITPVTLRPRFNAVASTGEEFTAGGLPWQVDPRQPALFAAAWTLGSLAALAGTGVGALTYYDTVGPCGVAERPEGSPDPATFRSRPDRPYPLAVVLADACGLSGGAIREVHGVDPAVLAALAVDLGGRTVLLLANLTRHARRVRVRARDGARGRVRMLDERTCEQAVADLAAFLPAGDPWHAQPDAVVTLHPYGVARLDVHDE